MIRVDLYQDDSGLFHYQFVQPGARNATKVPTACGLAPDTLKEAAWFRVGDPRGQVHFARACDPCREELTI